MIDLSAWEWNNGTTLLKKRLHRCVIKVNLEFKFGVGHNQGYKTNSCDWPLSIELETRVKCRDKYLSQYIKMIQMLHETLRFLSHLDIMNGHMFRYWPFYKGHVAINCFYGDCRFWMEFQFSFEMFYIWHVCLAGWTALVLII